MLFELIPRVAIATFVVLFSTNPLAPAAYAAEGAPDRLRNIQFEYRTDIPVTDSQARKLEVWIPLPREDGWQRVEELSIDTPSQHEIVTQDIYGNRLLHIMANSPLPTTLSATIRFQLTRREQAADVTRAMRDLAEPSDGSFAPYLRSDRLVPTTGRIAEVSANLQKKGVSPYQQARVIYEYVTSVMKYDKTGKGWGRGDAVYACDIRRGNCTDFHSLFIALARARGIPARFIIGFPLGTERSGQIPGYHCWAEFYSGGVWVPVDASEAWKNPSRHDYYFGHLDADRVAFTMGRDLALKPPQRGALLNYLIYPYAELDGAPIAQDKIKSSFAYHDVSPGK
jgi:transglutaminase-like putative cysteine protease